MWPRNIYCFSETSLSHWQIGQYSYSASVFIMAVHHNIYFIWTHFVIGIVNVQLVTYLHPVGNRKSLLFQVIVFHFIHDVLKAIKVFHCGVFGSV